MHLKLFKLTAGDYLVIIDGESLGNGLCLDEALGTIAQAIYTPGDERFIRDVKPGENPEPAPGDVEWTLELLGNRRKDSYSVIWGRLFANELVQCEALGTVASIMFGKPLAWLTTYEGWTARERTRLPHWSRWREPVAMLGGPN